MANKATLKIITNEKGSTKTKTIKYSTTDQETVEIFKSVDGATKEKIGEITYAPGDVPPTPPTDKPPVVDAGEDAKVIQGVTVTLDGSAHDDGSITRAEWKGPDGIIITPDPQDNTKASFVAPTIPEGQNVVGLIFFFEAEDDKANISKDSCIITVTKDGTIPPLECPPGQHLENGVCVPDQIDEMVLYDSLIHSKLHDGNVRTVKQEGDISPGGLGVECRASGNPRIVVNADGTFSLLCDVGHGRIYLYCKNYNATLEVTAAWMNSVSGQDCSQKDRSVHNESVDDPARNNNDFGGYGFSIDRTSYSAKREPFHNTHDQSESGSLPETLKTGEFWTTTFTTKDENNGVRQTATLNGKQVMDKLDSSPKPYMVGEARFNQQSYVWIRQNIDSGTGELRIKRIRVLKA